MEVRIHLTTLDPPSGDAAREGGEPHAFTGWLELMSVVERLCQDGETASGGTASASTDDIRV